MSSRTWRVIRCTPVHRCPAASSGKKILTQLRRSHTKLSRQGVEGPLAGIIYPRDRVFVGRDPLSNKESAAIIYELRHYAQKRIKLPTQSGVRTRLSGPPGGTGLCPVRAQSRRPICDPYPVRCPEKDKLWSEPPFGGFDSACPNQARRRIKGRGCLSAIPFRLHGREPVTL